MISLLIMFIKLREDRLAQPINFILYLTNQPTKNKYKKDKDKTKIKKIVYFFNEE